MVDRLKVIIVLDWISKKKEETKAQFQNPKFGDFFFVFSKRFYPREISSLRGIGVPTRSPFLFAGEEKGASIGKRDRATDASERVPWFFCSLAGRNGR